MLMIPKVCFFPSADGFRAGRRVSALVVGAPSGRGVSGKHPCLHCSLLPVFLAWNTVFKISPGFARHPAAGRRIPAKKKGRFPASKPSVPSALARSRRGFASCWGPSRGSVSPRPLSQISPQPPSLPAPQRGSLCGYPALRLSGLFTALSSAALKSQASSSCK